MEENNLRIVHDNNYLENKKTLSKRINNFNMYFDFLKNILFVIFAVIYHTIKKDVISVIISLETNIDNIINEIQNLPNTLKNGITSIL